MSGQILLWDLRAKSQPVLKSVFSGQGHAHSVTHISMVGSKNAHHLLSSSADGRICLWQLDMLSYPIEALDLVHPHYARADQMGITCLGLRAGEASTLWIGTEEGAMYQVNRFDRAGR